LIVSLIYTLLLLIPVKTAYLREPEIYYKSVRDDYEIEFRSQEDVDLLIKTAYIGELEEVIKFNKNIFNRKEIFYRNAFTFAILSFVPYIICIGFQLSINNNLKKVNMTKEEFKIIDYYARISDDFKASDFPREIVNIPGMGPTEVIHVYPIYLSKPIVLRDFWDNEVTRFVWNIFTKPFRKRKA
jgi:hypothetical protein